MLPIKQLMIRSFIILMVFISCTSTTWLIKEDKICDPLEKDVMFPYSGFRIQRQYTYGLPTLHHTRLSHCDMGFVDSEAYIPVDRNTDIAWGQNMCVDVSQCFRPVRTKKYALRRLNLYLPYTFVGGLFLCPSNGSLCTNRNARPVLPLLADRLDSQWTEFPRYRRVVHRIPYLFTPNIIDPRYPHRLDLPSKDWASKLDVNENYTYSLRERLTVSTVTNKLLNAIHILVSVNPEKIPWEKDRLANDLERDFIDDIFSLSKQNISFLYDVLNQIENM